MTYFLDANILLQLDNYDFKIGDTANEDFWEWIKNLGENENVKIPQKVYDEIENEPLIEWLKENKTIFFTPSTAALQTINEVLGAYGDGVDLNEEEVDLLKADPWLIAHAFCCEGTVVSNEVPRNCQRLNKKIPTICAQLGVRCVRLERFLWDELASGPSA